MALTPASDIMAVLKKHLGLDEKTYAVFQLWEKEFKGLYRGAELEGIKDGMLYLSAASSAHLQELTLRRKEMLTRINQYFGGKKTVKGIKIKLKDQ